MAHPKQAREKQLELDERKRQCENDPYLPIKEQITKLINESQELPLELSKDLAIDVAHCEDVIRKWLATYEYKLVRGQSRRRNVLYCIDYLWSEKQLFDENGYPIW